MNLLCFRSIWSTLSCALPSTYDVRGPYAILVRGIRRARHVRLRFRLVCHDGLRDGHCDVVSHTVPVYEGYSSTAVAQVSTVESMVAVFQEGSMDSAPGSVREDRSRLSSRKQRRSQRSSSETAVAYGCRVDTSRLRSGGGC